jgi:hypothetical protein
MGIEIALEAAAQASLIFVVTSVSTAASSADDPGQDDD